MIKIEQPISVIICAYNEAKNIGAVLKVLDEIKWIDEILVVDDCSLDHTSAQAEKHHRVKVIRHEVNQGKGGALATGIENAKNDLLLFLDADLLGLTEKHLRQLISPVLFTYEADMTLGVFGKGELSATNIANKMIPGISGQRVVWKHCLPDAQVLRDKRYGVDIFLTRQLPEDRIVVIELDGLSQVTKEDKEKFFEAMKSRMKMYKDIYKTLKEEKEIKKQLEDK